MFLHLAINRRVVPTGLLEWQRMLFNFLVIIFAVAVTPNDAKAQNYSTPLLTDWTSHMEGTRTIQTWTSKMADVGCPLSSSPLPWAPADSGRRIYSGGGSELVHLAESQNFNIQTSADTNCQTALYNISTCGGTCSGYTRNGRTRGLYCAGGGSLSQALIGSQWLWACPGLPPKIVAVDPGHGFSCPAMNLPSGAEGVTDFPANDPPQGRLQEDALTVAIALELERALPTAKYKAVLTKRDANTCLTYKDRGRIANNANAKVFVSIHVNSGSLVGGLFASGTSVLYNSAKPQSKAIADQIAFHVASNLGVNNRGSSTADELAVLKPTVTQMSAVLVEAARLRGDDERKLHAPGAVARVAEGIKAGLDASLGN